MFRYHQRGEETFQDGIAGKGDLEYKHKTRQNLII